MAPYTFGWFTFPVGCHIQRTVVTELDFPRGDPHLLHEKSHLSVARGDVGTTHYTHRLYLARASRGRLDSIDQSRKDCLGS